jgi:hypothetical protein
MNSETYLNKLRGDGDLAKQLKFMASEYTGPSGQHVTIWSSTCGERKSATVLEAARIKRQALLDAVKALEEAKEFLSGHQDLMDHHDPKSYFLLDIGGEGGN